MTDTARIPEVALIVFDLDTPALTVSIYAATLEEAQQNLQERFGQWPSKGEN